MALSGTSSFPHSSLTKYTNLTENKTLPSSQPPTSSSGSLLGQEDVEVFFDSLERTTSFGLTTQTGAVASLLSSPGSSKYTMFQNTLPPSSMPPAPGFHDVGSSSFLPTVTNPLYVPTTRSILPSPSVYASPQGQVAAPSWPVQPDSYTTPTSQPTFPFSASVTSPSRPSSDVAFAGSSLTRANGLSPYGTSYLGTDLSTAWTGYGQGMVSAQQLLTPRGLYSIFYYKTYT